jgi:hypothetical protein
MAVGAVNEAPTPDKSRYRTSAALELHISGKRVNQALGGIDYFFSNSIL